jgi:hypothetical protein
VPTRLIGETNFSPSGPVKEGVVADLGDAGLRPADPVGQQTHLDVVTDDVGVGDGVGAAVGEVSGGSSGHFLVVGGCEIPDVQQRAIRAHQLRRHISVGCVHNDSPRVRTQRVVHVGSVDVETFVGLQDPRADNVVTQVGVGGCGHNAYFLSGVMRLPRCGTSGVDVGGCR